MGEDIRKIPNSRDVHFEKLKRGVEMWEDFRGGKCGDFLRLNAWMIDCDEEFDREGQA
jgi:hypothetical protein